MLVTAWVRLILGHRSTLSKCPCNKIHRRTPYKLQLHSTFLPILVWLQESQGLVKAVSVHMRKMGWGFLSSCMSWEPGISSERCLYLCTSAGQLNRLQIQTQGIKQKSGWSFGLESHPILFKAGKDMWLPVFWHSCFTESLIALVWLRQFSGKFVRRGPRP